MEHHKSLGKKCIDYTQCILIKLVTGNNFYACKSRNNQPMNRYSNACLDINPVT
jgi:hypothetical protein